MNENDAALVQFASVFAESSCRESWAVQVLSPVVKVNTYPSSKRRPPTPDIDNKSVSMHNPCRQLAPQASPSRALVLPPELSPCGGPFVGSPLGRALVLAAQHLGFRVTAFHLFSFCASFYLHSMIGFPSPVHALLAGPSSFPHSRAVHATLSW